MYLASDKSLLVIMAIIFTSAINTMCRYNSVLFSSLSSYDYALATVSESFVHGGTWNEANTTVPILWYAPWGPGPPEDVWNETVALRQMQESAFDASKMINLTKTECLQNYSDFYARRSNLLIVVEDLPGEEARSVLRYEWVPALIFHGYIPTVAAPCANGTEEGPDCVSTPTQSQLDHWTKLGRSVLYCLSQQSVNEGCTLSYSPIIMLGRTISVSV